MKGCKDFKRSSQLYKNDTSYPIFVHAIPENINGLGLYHIRLEAECDTRLNR